MQREHVDVINALHAAAGDHGNIHAPRQINGRVDIAAGQHPVAADIGEQDGRNACIFEPACQINHRHVGFLGPALGRNKAVACVDCDDNAVFKFARHVFDELRVFERRGANHQPRDAHVEPAFNRLRIADASTQLDVTGKILNNALNRLGIFGASSKGAIQIYNMQELRALFGKQHRLRCRVIGIDRCAVHIALGQAHNFATLQVNRGEDYHSCHSKKRLRKLMP